jgi:hypothetical protein
MAIATSKCLFLHIPKTAGTFVRAVLESIDKVSIVGADIHAHFPDINDHLNRPIFCFVRHPLTWYLSRFSHRLRNGWVASHPLDSKCASNDFDQFVENVCQEYPDGWLTNEYNTFIDSAPTKPTIGRLENLYDDLHLILTSFKYRISRSRITKLGYINASHFGKLKPVDVIKYSEETAQKILRLERQVVHRFYENHDSMLVQ